MRNDKVFKSLDEQVEIIKKKGIRVDDIEKAKTVLLRENYFFISGYRHLFINNETGKYYSDVTFDELYSAFLFDRSMRNIFFKWILVVENNLKSILSYVLSKNYGYKDSEYLKPCNFTADSMKQRQVRDVLKKAERQVRVNGSEHTATLHYKNNYGYIPLWVIVKVLSFGIMSEFFSVLKSEDRQEISDIYKIPADSLETYLSIVSNYRNICAHEEILYSHRTQKSVPHNQYFDKLNIPKEEDEYKYGSNDLYGLLIIMKELLTKDDFQTLIREIEYEVNLLDGKIESVEIDKILGACGFPSNWLDIKDL